ncbi:UDP-N-acetylmuramoyl-tripeptide--D-alanyl-D-alanine ligase [Flavobacteriaceae bacterium]|nr:UDP-N-acetylmuramoyl-tripeptide--D-alanyl-D-alanine ligase [Flavobacteriaceae bacterium]
MQIEKLYAYFLGSTGVATDTRKIKKGCLFFCLKGENFDGNTFAEEALTKGAMYVVVDEPKHLKNNHSYLLVQDSLESLQKLAHYHRIQFSIPVIGLTGSNGKTTTKELINSVLSQQYKTTATAGNLNNHIGVPLTLLNINSKTEVALIEMGANHLDEIAFLCELAQPTLGYITNFGKAHLEGFGSLEGVVKGKSELYHFLKKNKGIALINQEDQKQSNLTRKQKTFSFGQSNKVDLQIKNKPIGLHKNISIEVDGMEIKSGLKGDFNFSNIGAAAAFGFYFKVSLEIIKKGIEKYVPSNNRSQWCKTDSNTLVLDAYNANPSSMRAALESFLETEKKGRLLILGDMLELGNFSEQEHQKIVNFIEFKEIDQILLVGPEFKKTKSTALNIKKFLSTNEVIPYLQKTNFQNKTIFIKGSRGIALEVLKKYL